MKGFLYKSFSWVGGDHLVWKLDSGRLRILCYHGVCEDRLAKEPWMPLFFVTQTAFESQLRYLRQRANVLPLCDAVRRLHDGSLPPAAVSLTFDDGYANNLQMAYPLLERYEVPATIFLSTAYVESGDLHPFLRLKLIRLSGYGDTLPDYKVNPLDLVMDRAGQRWAEVRAGLTGDQKETLRPLTVNEVQATDPQLVEYGGHSHTHCILRNETQDRRQDEIRTSIRKVEQWTGRAVRLFSYPNGEQSDFGEVDKQVLRAENIQAAVTGIAGANDSRVDSLELRRYPAGIDHDDVRFRAEVTGFRNVLRRVAGSLSL